MLMDKKPLTLKEYNQRQIEAMEIHKWIESEKAGYDLGPAAHRDWIEKYAAQFHEENPVITETDKLAIVQKLDEKDGVSEDIP